MENKLTQPVAEDVIKSFDLEEGDDMSLLFQIFEDFSGIKMKEDIFSFVLMATSTYADTARHGFLPKTVLEKKAQPPKVNDDGSITFTNLEANMIESFNETFVLPFYLKYHNQIKAAHLRYKRNQLSPEEFYQKYKNKLPEVWDFLRREWGASLEDFLSQTPCSEADVIACTDKFKHDLFGFIAVFCMDEVQNSWPQNLEFDDRFEFTAEDVIALGGRF